MNKNKRYILNIYNLIGLLVSVVCVYFLLLRDSQFPCSIHSVMTKGSELINHWPVLVVGLLPVYVALMIFGIATIGLYLGSLLERIIARCLHKQKAS